jgi:hypothetical protein
MTATPHNDPRHPHSPTCFGCKVAGFGIGAKAFVTRNPGLVDRKKTEQEYEVNRPAYVRLKKEGLQPKKFTNAAEVEKRAVSKFEIESGHDFKGDEKKGKKADETQLALRTGSGIEV